MALGPRLDLRQSQSLVMTPQLQQAIKLLQLSNLELGQFVETELERNPLLEREERAEQEGADQPDTNSGDPDKLDGGGADATGSEPDSDEEWLDLNGATAANDANGALDNGLDNLYPDAGDGAAAMPGAGPSEPSWANLRTSRSGGDGQDVNLEAFVAHNPSLADHLTEQLQLAISDPRQRLIGHHLIDLVDDAGYLTVSKSSVR